jgi:hypothetical protein
LARLTGAKAKKINKKYAAGESFGICKLWQWDYLDKVHYLPSRSQS